MRWLESRASNHNILAAAQDIQATLAQLTASSIINALTSWGNDPTALVICGGGRYNIDSLNRLKRASLKLKNRLEVVEPSEHWGVDGDVNRGRRFCMVSTPPFRKSAGYVAAVTGSRGERIPGAIY